MKLWVAQGFGIGRIPVAPGTFGSAVGLLWFGLLLMTGNLWLFIAGTIAAVALSVWLCGAKPWPVYQSQSLPGGWGVTIDDLLAAVYVNVAALLVYAGKTLL